MSCPFKAMQKDAAALRARSDATDKPANGTAVNETGTADTDSGPSSGAKVTFSLGIPVLDKSKRPAGPATYITLEEGPVMKVGGDDSTSEPSNYGSGEGSPRTRKTSNISTTSSLGSEGDSSELAPERKVDLNGLIEGVGTLIIPAVSRQGRELVDGWVVGGVSWCLLLVFAVGVCCWCLLLVV